MLADDNSHVQVPFLEGKGSLSLASSVLEGFPATSLGMSGLASYTHPGHITQQHGIWLGSLVWI